MTLIKTVRFTFLIQFLCLLSVSVWASDIHVSTNKGASWSALDKSLTTIHSSANGNELIGVDAAGYMHIKRGSAWNKLTNPSGKVMSDVVNGATSGLLYAVATDDTLWWSTNYGSSWTKMNGALSHIAVGTDNSFWGVNTHGEIWGTYTLGKKWIKASAPTSGDKKWRRVSGGKNGMLLAVSGNNSIWKSQNKGSQWSLLKGGLVEVSAAADGSIWGVNSANQVWQTSNYGESWTHIKGVVAANVAAVNERVAYRVSPQIPEANNVVTLTPISMVTTTTSLGNTAVNKCPTGMVWREAVNSQLFKTPAGCFKDNSAGETVKVEGCANCAKTLDVAYQILSPCVAKKSSSLLLSNNSSSLRKATLPNNSCNGRYGKPSEMTYFQTTQAEYELVSQYFVQLENTFIKALKDNPSLVLNYDNENLLKKLAVSKGKVTYSELEAFVYGELINSIMHPANERTKPEQAAVEWFIRGAVSAELKVWKEAQKQYERWMLNPCAFKPPGKFHDTTWDGMYRNCGGGNNPLAQVFKIGKVQQAHPKLANLIEWGAYLAGDELLDLRQSALLNRSISMGAVYIVGTGVLATGAAATVLAIGGGTLAAAIFPFSTAIVAAGGIVQVTASSAAFVAPIGATAGTLAAPALVVVGAIVGSVAAITMTMDDIAFHNRMTTDELTYNVIGQQVKFSEIQPERLLTFYGQRLAGKTNINGLGLSDFELMAGNLNGMGNSVEETDPSGAIEFAFADAMNFQNHTRLLPVTVPLTKSSVANSNSAASNAWITNKTATKGGFGIEYLEQDVWHKITGAGEQIAVDQNNNPWTVNAAGEIWFYSNNAWQNIAGKAKDISSGGGKVWVVGTDAASGGYAIYERNGSSWKRHNIGALRLDVDSAGQPWIVNSKNEVFHYKNGKSQLYSGIKAKDIASGGGQTWVISVSNSIYKLVGTSWKKMSGAAVRIDVDAQGNPIVTNHLGIIYRWSNGQWTKLSGKANDVSIKNT